MARGQPRLHYRLWHEDAIDALGLRNDGIYRRYLAEGLYDGAADVARIEILHRFGGVYTDADSVALRPLGAAPFMAAGFLAPFEPNDEHRGSSQTRSWERCRGIL